MTQVLLYALLLLLLMAFFALDYSRYIKTSKCFIGVFIGNDDNICGVDAYIWLLSYQLAVSLFH